MPDQTTPDLDEIGDDLKFTRIERRTSAPGTWVNGKLNGHRFSALVFPEHAECPDYELQDSRISKLWVQRLSDKECVFNWDRGMDRNATDPMAQGIVDFLCVGLADAIYYE